MCVGCLSNTVNSATNKNPGTIEADAIVPDSQLKSVALLKKFANSDEFELNGSYYQPGSLEFVCFKGVVSIVGGSSIAVGKMFFNVNYDKNKEKKSFSILSNKLV